jgi:protein PsiE
MQKINNMGHVAITWISGIGLFVIAIATIFAMGYEIYTMIKAMRVTLADLLLLFIYLEVLAMISIYLKSGKLPVRMPLYIAIVALARYLVIDMKDIPTLRMLGISGAALIIGITILVIRYGHIRFPYGKEEDV